MKVDFLIIIYKSRFLNSCLAKKRIDFSNMYPSRLFIMEYLVYLFHINQVVLSPVQQRNTHTVIRIYCKNNFFEIRGYFLEKQIHEVKSQNHLFYDHFIFMIVICEKENNIATLMCATWSYKGILVPFAQSLKLIVHSTVYPEIKSKSLYSKNVINITFPS